MFNRKIYLKKYREQHKNKAHDYGNEYRKQHPRDLGKQRIYNRKYYQEHREHLVEIATRNLKRRRCQQKLKAVALFGGKCQKCGYNKCVDALDFHHEVPSIKEYGMGVIFGMSWKKILIELEKCELLCSNCHRETHAALRLDGNN